ncbi:MAG TPA: tetratricopeptide repeat protein, partial [Levilinea sp.]|nr:tetratricopeptide repeat protein [Levilinea sp.]
LSINGRVAFGEVYWRQADFDTAMKTWQPLFERGQAEVWLFERAAEFRRAAGDRQALAEILQMWAAAYPTMAEPAYELAILLLPDDPESSKTFLRAASRQDAALRGHIFTLEQALERAATEEITAYGQVLVGRTLASLGEWEAAERTFELATQMNSEYAEAWAFLAEARQQNGSDGQAAIEKALAADPQSIAARTLAALFWRRAGDRETGLAYLQDLAADFPQQGVWQVEIAHTLAEMGKYDQALDHLHLATTVEPVNAEFWYILGRFCVDNRLHVREIGLPAARHALSLALANPDMHDLMGLVLLRLEDEIGAERFLRRALQINPAHASAHLHLGQLYLNHHKYLKAAVHLRQARDSAGENQAGVGIIAARLLEQYGLAGQ